MVKKKGKIKAQPIMKSGLRKEIWRHKELYMFILPAVISMIIFKYVPIYGVLMAFQDVKIGDTFGQSKWVGLYHFKRFFSSSWLPTTLRNTVSIAFLTHVLSWPIPPFLAILLHNSSSKRIRKVVQNFTYLPYLLSIVVVVSILNVFLAGETGLVNIILHELGLDRVNFFGDPKWVYPLHFMINLWKNTGYNAIVYLGALSAVDEQMIEAARVDGAGKLRCIWNIQLPTIMPTVVTMLILNMGQVFTIGTDTALILQTDLNLARSEVIGTYVYKAGIEGAQYGFSTAIGLFQNLVNFAMLMAVNFIAGKLSDTSVL